MTGITPDMPLGTGLESQGVAQPLDGTPLSESLPLERSSRTQVQPTYRKRKVPLFKALAPQRIDWELEEEPPNLLRTVSNPPLPSLNLLLMIAVSAAVIVLSGMVSFSVPDVLSALWQPGATFYYAPQIPLTLFTAAVLGMTVGLMAMIGVLIVGLFVMPVFAAGGGLDYILQPTFPYYVGMMVGMVLSCLILQKALIRKEMSGRSLMLLFSAILGVSVAHIIGTVGLMAYGVFGLMPWVELPHWWIQATGAPIVYDLAAAMFLFCLVRLTRLGLWVALY